MQPGGQGPGPGGTLLLHRPRHLGHIRRLGARADGVGEHVHGREAALLQKRQGGGELLLRLLGEAADHVGGDGGVVKVPPQQVHGLPEPGGVVPAVHPMQGGVAAGLQGQVEMGAQVGQSRRPAAEVLGDGPGLQAAQPQPQPGRGRRNGLHQVDEAGAVAEILAPGGDLDAGEHQLPIALGLKLAGLGYRLVQGQGAHRTPGKGDDAVGAEVHASVLHLQHGPGPGGQAPGRQHLEAPPPQGVIHRHPGGAVPDLLLQQVQKGHPVPGAADQVDAQGLCLVGVSLDIAAAHCHHPVGAHPPGPADGLAGFLVADGGDGTGVDDVSVGTVLKVHQLVAPAAQLLLHGLGLVLVHLAAQRVNGSSHGDSPCTFRVNSV